VQQLLGHASVRATALYTRVVTGELAQVVSEKRPRERLWKERGKRAQAVANGKR
jgi:site-specific recombinase XerC